MNKTDILSRSRQENAKGDEFEKYNKQNADHSDDNYIYYQLLIIFGCVFGRFRIPKSFHPFKNLIFRIWSHLFIF